MERGFLQLSRFSQFISFCFLPFGHQSVILIFEEEYSRRSVRLDKERMIVRAVVGWQGGRGPHYLAEIPTTRVNPPFVPGWIATAETMCLANHSILNGPTQG